MLFLAGLCSHLREDIRCLDGSLINQNQCHFLHVWASLSLCLYLGARACRHHLAVPFYNRNLASDAIFEVHLGNPSNSAALLSSPPMTQPANQTPSVSTAQFAHSIYYSQSPYTFTFTHKHPRTSLPPSAPSHSIMFPFSILLLYVLWSF